MFCYGQAMASWLGVDHAAKALVELAIAKRSPLFAHIVHPRPVRWNKMMQDFASVLSVNKAKAVRLVPYSEWLSELEKLDHDLQNVGESRAESLMQIAPALTLIEYFRQEIGIDVVLFATDLTC